MLCNNMQMFYFTYDSLGLSLQISGIIVVLFSQIIFLRKLRKKYKTLRRGFLAVAAMRWGVDTTDMTDEEVKKVFPKFPLAEWVYSDVKISLIGLGITLGGLVLEFLPL